MKWLILTVLLVGCKGAAPDSVGVSFGYMFASDGSTVINRTPGTTGSVAFDYETDDVPVALLNFDWLFGARARHREDTAQRERLHNATMKVQENNHMMLMAIGTKQGVVMPSSDGHTGEDHEEKDKAFAYMGITIAGVCLSLMALITFLVKGKKKSETS